MLKKWRKKMALQPKQSHDEREEERVTGVSE